MRYFRSNNGPRDRRGQHYQYECELRDRDEQALERWEAELRYLEKNNGSKEAIEEAKGFIENLKKDLETYNT